MSARPEHIPPFEALGFNDTEGIAWWYRYGTPRPKTLQALAQQTGRSRPGVAKLLARLGVPIRKSCDYSTALPDDPPPPAMDAAAWALLNEVSLGVVRMLLAVNCSRRLRGAPCVYYFELAAQVDEESATPR